MIGMQCAVAKPFRCGHGGDALRSIELSPASALNVGGMFGNILLIPLTKHRWRVNYLVQES